METKHLYKTNYSVYFNLSAFEHYDKALEEWEAIKAEYEKNKITANERNLIRRTGWNEFLELMDKYHLDLSSRTLTTLKSAFIPTIASATMPSLWAWYKIGEDIYKADSGTGYGDNFKRAFDIAKAHYERSLVAENQRNERLKKAIEYCIEKQLAWDVNNAVQVAYNYRAHEIEEELQGQTIEIDCCDECHHWTVGERRCSCGNRRVSLVIDGVFPDLYWFAEAY